MQAASATSSISLSDAAMRPYLAAAAAAMHRSRDVHMIVQSVISPLLNLLVCLCCIGGVDGVVEKHAILRQHADDPAQTKHHPPKHTSQQQACMCLGRQDALNQAYLML
jgi:hypothetical protein